jgi:hypothetical protein
VFAWFLLIVFTVERIKAWLEMEFPVETHTQPTLLFRRQQSVDSCFVTLFDADDEAVCSIRTGTLVGVGPCDF